ncbi:S-layer homology domain-containing protein [Oscillibacter sp. PC13]|uniref:S-layer homology domain-containing protein n=1 Tax=Oscillibacter sp. PC13 TaxID=1855299 RepID=UPI0008E10807|nr:S-layer homology domain-containing protein [Oscillibacter sp. PC13]SFQ00561.1 S-layer homology domain-containing protein [Oscillibacter sp. PC13]
MRGFWKKQLPAFLLAMVMVVGMVPAAMAEGEEHKHVYGEAWKNDADSHWHVCTVKDCTAKSDYESHKFGDIVVDSEPTCYQAGTGHRICSVCGYSKSESITATGNHTASDDWSYNTTKHWHACTAASGCPEHLNEASHSYASGEYSSNSSSHWQICTICGGSSSKASHTDSNGDGVCDVCKYGGLPVSSKITVTFKNGSSTHSTQEVSKGSRPSKPSNPTMSGTNKTYTFKGWVSGSNTKAVYTGQSLIDVASTTVSSNTTYSAAYTVKATSQNGSLNVDGTASGVKVGSDLRSTINGKFSNITGTSFSNVRFTSLSSSTYGKLYTSSSKSTSVSTSSSSSYSYSSVANFYFVPTSKDTFTIGYTATDDNGNSVSGSITLNVDASSTSGKTITYKVDAGDEVSFDRSDFQSAYREEYDSGTIKYVTFETTASLSTSNGTVYYNYDRSGEKAFTKSNIDSYNFYYSNSDYGDYALNSLSFAAPKDADSRTVKLTYRACYSSSDYVEGTVEIKVSGSGSSADGDITYQVDPGDEVDFDADDFNDYFQEEYDNYTLRYVTFETDDTLSTSEGTVYYNYGKSSEKAFTKSSIDDYKFYYEDSDYGDYDLSKLSFVAPDDADEQTVEISFTAYYSTSRKVTGTLIIEIGEGDGTSSKADITYQVDPDDEVEFDRTDFNDYFQEEYSSYTIKYVTFKADSTLVSSNGVIYSDYDGDDEKSFTKGNIDDYKFYYKNEDDGDYALNSLSFVASDDFDTAVTLTFTAYYSGSRYVEGTLRIEPKSSTAANGKGDIRYYTTYNTNVQINPNDIARFFNEQYPNNTLSYIELGGVPSSGSLYYDYYGVSKYGSSKLKLTSSNCDDQKFYFSPSSTSQYALSELTYIPSGVNYCASIPFTAYSTGSRSVSGTILISVTYSTVSEVYGVTPKGTSVAFPASAIYTAVSSATGMTLGSIQLLELPASSVGTVYVGSGTSTKASTSVKYDYSTGSQRISQLRFVPASGFTGSVEIPYVAYSTNGNAIASGKFCLGVVNSVKKFSDVTSSTWCYKYVAELSDAKVIDGYQDGSFRPNNTVTYGQALKLIMLASGYSVQQPTGSHPFSGYLAKAKSAGLVTGNIDLDRPITRLAVAQIAAKAMKLNTSDLSSVKPFTDTSDVYVQALYAAGIVEGYFSNGTSTYKPSNTLTRGQISAIVWRMERAN